MNFFKSILSDDPEPTNPQKPDDSDSDSDSPPNDVASSSTTTSAWSFGDLIQTIATRSESVIETYRKDLQEFSTGLKNETQIVRDVANRAVKDLPTSIEAGKSALDTVLKSTAEIISKETLFFNSDNETDTPESNRKRYSWFETQLGLIGNDEATFVEEPEDLEEFRKWRVGVELEERSDEIEDLIGENGALEEIYIRVVPGVVDDETFWLRYFYRVEKLKVQEKVRANLVKRAIVVDDDEELSWDVDDEEDEDKGEGKDKGKNVVGNEGVSDQNLNADVKEHEGEKKDVDFNVERGGSSDVGEESSEKVGEEKVEEVAQVKSDEKVESEEIMSEKSNESVALDVKEVKDEEVAPVESAEEVKLEESVEKKNEEEKVKDDLKSDAGETKGEEEEDMGWDEIENIGSDDEKKISATTTGSGSPNRDELRKRLSVADDEDEDLSWDIEEDDEPVKA